MCRRDQTSKHQELCRLGGAEAWFIFSTWDKGIMRYSFEEENGELCLYCNSCSRHAWLEITTLAARSFSYIYIAGGSTDSFVGFALCLSVVWRCGYEFQQNEFRKKRNYDVGGIWTPDLCCSFVTDKPLSYSVSPDWNLKAGPVLIFYRG